jgi:hypothetical protein
MLAQLDKRICDAAQAAYCHLLDRYGVRLGDVVCVLTIAQLVTPRAMLGYAAALACIAIGCWVSAQQGAGRHERINRAAEFIRSLLILRGALVGFAIFNVASGRHALWDEALTVVLAYVLTCKVRKRDEDRFHKRRLAADRA